MVMPKGKKNPNAGRKRGSSNKKTKEAIAKAEATGKMPLEIMVDLMRREYTKGQKLAGKSPDSAREHFAAAFDYAQGAAPYLHAKLQSITQKDERIDLSKLTDEELDWLHRIKLKASGQHPAS